MTLDGIGGKNVSQFGDLPEFKFSDNEAREIEAKTSIFMKDNKFVPVKETVKLVDVKKDGKLIYEDGKGTLFTANSQHELSELKEKDGFKLPGFLGGIVDKAKSMFGTEENIA